MRLRAAAVLCLLPPLLVACGVPRSSGPDSRRQPRRSSDRRPPENAAPAIPIPAGVRMVSFGAERDWAVAGALLEPPWCVQLSAEVRDTLGEPAAGVPVTFRLDRRSGRGSVLGAALSHETALTDAAGRARALLVSSDRPERCQVWATCGAVSLGAAVEFIGGLPAAITVGPSGPGERPLHVPFSDERAEAMVLRLVRTAAAGEGAAAERAREEVRLMGSAAVTPLLLIIYAEHRPPAERREAVGLLSRIRDVMILDRLLEGLDDGRAAARAGAETALGALGPARAGPGVRRAVRLSGPFGRCSALRVLAEWGRLEDVAVIASQAGADPDPLVRATAVWKLKAFLDRPESRAALRAAAADRSPFVRYAAARSIGLTPALAPGAADAAWEGLSDVLLRDPDVLVRAAAALALTGRNAGERLSELAADPEPAVRRAAARALGRMLPDAAAAARLRTLSRDRDTGTADEAAAALVARGGPEDAEAMLDALAGRDRELSAAALDSLERCFKVELGRPEPGAAPEEELRGRWSDWVAACRDLSAAERFWLAAERGDSQLRGEALLAMVRALGTDAGDRSIRERAAALGAAMVASGGPRVRGAAAAALCLLGRPNGREGLLAEISSPDWAARLAACRAAGAVRSRETALALIARLDDESAAIREAALASLRQMAPELFTGEAADREGGAQLRAVWKKRAESLSMSATEKP